MSRPDNPDPFIQAVAAAIDRAGLLAPGAAVVVGVSGGADSVALLAALHQLSLAPGRGYKLIAAHLNHQLRAEAEKEEQFVGDLARRMGAGWESRRCDVTAQARRGGEGIEQAGRRLRYEFLRQVAERLSAGYVAVGHHADDQVETVLFRLFRGTHLRGLCGMAACRPLGSGGVKLIRPLLSVSRAEIEEFCRRNKLAWCTDASNEDVKFRRNFIRHELLPLLRSRVNPQLDAAILRMAESFQEIERHLAGEGQEVLAEAGGQPLAGGEAAVVLDRKTLARQTELIRRYAIRAALERAGVPMGAVGSEHLAALARMAEGAGPTAQELPGGWSARASGESLHICPPGGLQSVGQAPASWPPVELACPGRTALPDGREVICQVQPMDRRAFQDHCRRGLHDMEWLDADAIRGGLLCRPRRRGDAMTPLGLAGRQKVGKLLTNLKFPRRLRGQALCVCDQGGIVLLWPVRIDQRVKIAEATTKVVTITVRGGAAALDADGPGD